jgi:hypothetical protein
MKRLVTTIVVGCALIGQAHAFDFTYEQATRIFAIAVFSTSACPGIKLNVQKTAKILGQAGVVDASKLDPAKAAAVVREWIDQMGDDRYALCHAARDPELPMHRAYHEGWQDILGQDNQRADEFRYANEMGQ